MICDKCLRDHPLGVARTEDGITYKFCKFCDGILERIDKTGYTKIFINSDEELTEEEKNIINASRRRAEGKSPWNTPPMNKGGDKLR